MMTAGNRRLESHLLLVNILIQHLNSPIVVFGAEDIRFFQSVIVASDRGDGMAAGELLDPRCHFVPLGTFRPVRVGKVVRSIIVAIGENRHAFGSIGNALSLVAAADDEVDLNALVSFYFPGRQVVGCQHKDNRSAGVGHSNPHRVLITLIHANRMNNVASCLTVLARDNETVAPDRPGGVPASSPVWFRPCLEVRNAAVANAASADTRELRGGRRTAAVDRWNQPSDGTNSEHRSGPAVVVELHLRRVV